MRVDLNARVRTRDGMEAGRIRHAIFDPNSHDVTHFVIGTGGLFGRDIVVSRDDLVPPELVGETAGEEGTLVLNLSKDELDAMADFVPSNYSMPPSGWAPPSAYGPDAVGFLWTTGYAAEPPLIAREEEVADVGQGWVATSLTKGATVLDREGDDVGVIDELRVDPESGDVKGVLVRIGGKLQTLFGGGDTVVVPQEMIAGVGANEVHLRAGKEELRRIARSHKRAG